MNRISRGSQTISIASVVVVGCTVVVDITEVSRVGPIRRTLPPIIRHVRGVPRFYFYKNISILPNNASQKMNSTTTRRGLSTSMDICSKYPKKF